MSKRMHIRNIIRKEISFDLNQKKVVGREIKLNFRRIKETYTKYDLSEPSRNMVQTFMKDFHVMGGSKKCPMYL